MRALRNADSVELVNIPSLTKLVLRFAFVRVRVLTMENASMFESVDVLRDVQSKHGDQTRESEEDLWRRERDRKRREQGIVENAADFCNLPSSLTTITVNACGDYLCESLDFSRFTELEELKIGWNAFNYVSNVRVEGLAKLKTLVVDEGSFQNDMGKSGLVVKNCPVLATITIGNSSFKGFSACELSGLPQLQSLSLGTTCFANANLVLKDLENLSTVHLDDGSFEKSRHTVIESNRICLDSRVDCPKLKELEFGIHCLRGVESDHCDVSLKSIGGY